MKSRILILFLVLISAASARPAHRIHKNLPIDPILTSEVSVLWATPEPDVEDIDVVKNAPLVVEDRQVQADINYAVKDASCGFARITRVGLTVQSGSSGTLHYRIRVRAIEASILASSDKSFVPLLSKKERRAYYKKRRSYRGGLQVPFLQSIGIDLASNTTMTDIERSFDSQQNYNAKAAAAQRILETVVEQDIEISGTLHATGTSCESTTVFAFIKLARVMLQNGTSRTIVTTDPDELAAATADGSTVPSDSGTINIVPF